MKYKLNIEKFDSCEDSHEIFNALDLDWHTLVNLSNTPKPRIDISSVIYLVKTGNTRPTRLFYRCYIDEDGISFDCRNDKQKLSIVDFPPILEWAYKVLISLYIHGYVIRDDEYINNPIEREWHKNGSCDCCWCCDYANQTRINSLSEMYCCKYGKYVKPLSNICEYYNAPTRAVAKSITR